MSDYITSDSMSELKKDVEGNGGGIIRGMPTSPAILWCD